MDEPVNLEMTLEEFQQLLFILNFFSCWETPYKGDSDHLLTKFNDQMPTNIDYVAVDSLIATRSSN